MMQVQINFIFHPPDKKRYDVVPEMEFAGMVVNTDSLAYVVW